MVANMVRDRAPVLLVGPPGIGKTDITLQVREKTGYRMILSHPVVMDPTQVQGLGFADWENLVAKFLPFGHLHEAIHATEPTIWFLDDLGQAPALVQAAFMQLILARQIGEHKIPPCVTFVAATNRRQDRAGVKEFLSPLKSRMVTILHLRPSVPNWLSWAYRTGMPASIITLIRAHGIGMLFDENPTVEIENARSPRTWANAGRVLKNEGYSQGYGDDDIIEVDQVNDSGKNVVVRVNAKRYCIEAGLEGAVGQVGCNALLPFIDFSDELPDPNTALMSPATVELPAKADLLCVFGMTMAHMVKPATFGSFLTLVERLMKGANGEIAASLMLQEAIKLHPQLQEQPEFTQRVLTDDVLKEMVSAEG
jgi:hypothetical protein